MKVVTFGELMLRLAPNGYYRFFQNDQMQATFGGGEANVAVSLANYGHEAEFVTAVPNNEIGECALAALRKYNVSVANVAKCGERLGIYFLETGASMRASNVVYDRAHSSISTATEADFDFDAIFEGADWFHFTGITPALGDNVAAICLDALKVCKNRLLNAALRYDLLQKFYNAFHVELGFIFFQKIVQIGGLFYFFPQIVGALCFQCSSAFLRY